MQWVCCVVAKGPKVGPECCSTSQHAVNFSPSVTDELVNEKEKYKNIADEMDQAFSELSGF